MSQIMPDHGSVHSNRGDDGGCPPAHAYVAAFRSTVTDVLGECAGLPLAVIAATGDVERLRRRLSQTWHAAWTTAPPSSAEPFRRAHVDPIDVRYELMPFEARRFEMTAPLRGITFDAGRLRVALPTNATPADLDQLLCIALDDLRFDVLTRDPAAVRRRHLSGCAADVGPRYACRPGHPTVTLVRNVYAFVPSDLPDLLRAVALAREGLAVKTHLDKVRSTAASIGADR